jgi:hypothetical protein
MSEANARHRKTQGERLIDLLKTKEWVSLPAILDLRIAKYTSVISDLRKHGYVILNRNEEGADGIVHSWYHLAGEPMPGETISRIEHKTGQKELFQ